jgi:hypothetical protein
MKKKQIAAKSDIYMREPDVVCISDNSYEDEQKIFGNGLNELHLHPAFHYYESDIAKPYHSRGKISNIL